MVRFMAVAGEIHYFCWRGRPGPKGKKRREAMARGGKEMMDVWLADDETNTSDH